MQSEQPCIDRFAGEHAFLSNFFPAPFVLDGIVYPTVEHAFQAAKCCDAAQAERIRRAPSPGAAKRLGRRAQLRPDWEPVKLDVMHRCLRAKFAQHPDLAARLLATGSARLVEGNTWGDTFWGRTGSRGRNHLGRLLMLVRAELRGAASPAA